MAPAPRGLRRHPAPSPGCPQRPGTRARARTLGAQRPGSSNGRRRDPRGAPALGGRSRTESSPGCPRAHCACAVQGVGSPLRTAGRVRRRMRAKPVPGRGFLLGQPAYIAPARAEGGGSGSWWVLAAPPCRRCGRQPQRRSAAEVGFPWAARAAGPRVGQDVPGEGSSPEVCVSGRSEAAAPYRDFSAPSRLCADLELGAPPPPGPRPPSEHAYGATPIAPQPRDLPNHAHSAPPFP